MNAITIIIFVVAIAALIYGYNRGIVREAGSLCAILLGIVACRLMGDTATAIASEVLGASADDTMSHYAAALLGNAALFVIVWLGVWAFARMLRGAVHTAHLGIVDRLCGSLFSAAKWLLVLSLLLNLIYIMAPHASMWGADPPQGAIKAVLGYAPWLFGALTGAVTQ